MEKELFLDFNQILTKINSKEDLEEFGETNSLFIPKNNSFNFKFFVQFLDGKKKVSI
jgi:hypothetical protein